MIRSKFYLYRLIDYIKQGQIIAAYHLLKQMTKLIFKTECRCPNNSHGHKVEVIYWPRTAYHWKGNGKDPNGPYAICKEGAAEATAYWDEMWSEYYNQIL